MAITYEKMKTFTRPDGNDKVQYEIVDDAGRKMIAPDWDVSYDEAFAVGDYVVNDGKLYRFTSAHTAGDAWDDEEVTEITVTDEIQAIKSDVSGKASKVSGAVNGNFAALDGSGNLKDSGKKPSDFITEHQDISGKADKVVNGTSGNFVSLDANGNIQDSGSKASDFLTQHQDISGKADKDTDAVEGNFAAFDSNGNPIDSGHKHSDYLTAHQDISGKADKVTGGTADNLAALDASGNLKDSGTSATELKSAIDGKASLITDTVQNVAIASVPDAASNLPLTALRFAVEPIQAGSGDPYPGGGGKNLFEVTAETDTKNGTKFTINDDGSVTISGTPSSNTTYQLGVVTLPAGTYKVNGCAGGSTTTYRMACYNVTDSTTIASIYGGADTEFTLESEKQVRLYPVVITSFDGNPVTVYPMIRLASIADSTFAPYSNIRPITGRTSAVVAVTGKNLFCPSYADGVGKWANSSGVISDNQYGYISPYIKIGASGYIASAGAIFSQWAYLFYDANGNFLSRVLGSASTSGATLASGTIPSGAVWMRFQVYDTSGATTEKVTALKVQVEQGSTASSYTAYTGTTHTVQFGSTFYGGQIDWVNGQMVVDKAILTVNHQTSFDVANGAFFAEEVFPENTVGTVLNAKNFLCNKYIEENSISSSSNIPNRADMSFFNHINASRPEYARRLFVKDSRFNTAAAFQASLETEPIVIVYPLPEPITVTLTGLEEIKTEQTAGVNNFWADSGDIVELTYPCDTKLYVDKKIAETVALILEN